MTQEEKKQAAEEVAGESTAGTKTTAAPAEDAPAATVEEAVPVTTEEASPSPTAEEAFAALLAALTPADKKTLCEVIARLEAYEEMKKEAARVAEEDALLAAMEKEPAFAGIGERAGALRALIRSVSWLRELPARDRLAAACYIDRGMRWHTPTPEEKLESLLSDPALMRALAEKQAAARDARLASTPPMHPGIGRAPATVIAPPKSLHEAKREAKRSLHVKG